MGQSVRIIGVTRNIAWQPTRSQYKRYTVYVPFGSNQQGVLIVVIQAKGPINPLMGMLTRTIDDTLPSSAVFKIATLPQLVQGASMLRTAGAGMVGTFVSLSLLLAALGAWAITSFITRSRLGEYGIRASLGAGRFDLLYLGFREAFWLLLVGIPVGLGGAYLLGHVMSGALYGTPVFDPKLYVAGAAVITVVVIVAALGPARRAARVPIRDLLGSGQP